MDLFRLRSPGRKWMTPSPSISPKDKIGFASNHLPISQGSCLGLLKKGCRVYVTSFCHPLSVLVLDALWMDFNCEFVRIGWHLSPFLARFQWITGSSDGCFLRPKKTKKFKNPKCPRAFFLVFTLVHFWALFFWRKMTVQEGVISFWGCSVQKLMNTPTGNCSFLTFWDSSVHILPPPLQLTSMSNDIIGLKQHALFRFGKVFSTPQGPPPRRCSCPPNVDRCHESVSVLRGRTQSNASLHSAFLLMLLSAWHKCVIQPRRLQQGPM